MTLSTSSILAALSTTAVLAASTLALGGTAAANDDDRGVERTGSCSGSARWELKAHEDDGGIEVEGEVDSNRTGEAWSWRLVQNGVRVDRGTATTTGRSGSLDVERLVADRAGTDSFTFRAKNKTTGEVCKGTLAY